MRPDYSSHLVGIGSTFPHPAELYGLRCPVLGLTSAILSSTLATVLVYSSFIQSPYDFPPSLPPSLFPVYLSRPALATFACAVPGMLRGASPRRTASPQTGLGVGVDSLG